MLYLEDYLESTNHNSQTLLILLVKKKKILPITYASCVYVQ